MLNSFVCLKVGVSGFTPESEGLFNPSAPFAQPRRKLSLAPTQTASEKRRNLFAKKSLSQDSAASKTSSGNGNDQPPQSIFMGGSYSASTGCSSKIVDSWRPGTMNSSTGTPRLAQVAHELMRAKAAGELPSALKIVSRETKKFSMQLRLVFRSLTSIGDDDLLTFLQSTTRAGRKCIVTTTRSSNASRRPSTKVGSTNQLLISPISSAPSTNTLCTVVAAYNDDLALFDFLINFKAW